MAIIVVSFNLYLILVLIRLCYSDTSEQASEEDIAPFWGRSCAHVQLSILRSTSWSKLILLTVSALQLFHLQPVPKSAPISSPFNSQELQEWQEEQLIYTSIRV